MCWRSSGRGTFTRFNLVEEYWQKIINSVREIIGYELQLTPTVILLGDIKDHIPRVLVLKMSYILTATRILLEKAW